MTRNIWLPISENDLAITFPSDTGHVRIYWYEAISTINLLKQPKGHIELKLSNFKSFANCKIFICQLACLTTTINQPPKLLGIIASILFQYQVYFHLYKPFLFSWHLRTFLFSVS